MTVKRISSGSKTGSKGQGVLDAWESTQFDVDKLQFYSSTMNIHRDIQDKISSRNFCMFLEMIENCFTVECSSGVLSGKLAQR